MTEKEALKLALEALEEFGEHYDWCHQFPTYAFPENYPPCNCGYDEAITAIKEALREHAMYEVQRLGQEIQPEHKKCENCGEFGECCQEQPEQSENSDFQPDWMNYQQGYMDGMSQAIADMALEKDKPQPKEPEQEPVAWMRDDEMKAMVSDEKRAWILCGRSELIEDYNKPLYTTPPQRTWVGLTDEEIDECDWGQSERDHARAIEAKLKEKNT